MNNKELNCQIDILNRRIFGRTREPIGKDSAREMYEELTGVNIDEQKAIWDERGRGYYGEYLVFRTLFDELSDDSKILMNVEIPTGDGDKTTEIDFLLIHSTGIYCFEIKHFKGDIYCNFDEENWTQVLRTSGNNHFYSPLMQNQHHLLALKRLLPKASVYPFVIFTSDNVRLHDGRKNIFEHKVVDNTVICTLNWLKNNIEKFFYAMGVVYSTDDINNVFMELSQYSKLNQQVKTHDGEVMLLNEYLNAFHPVYQRKIREAEEAAKKRSDEIENKYADFFKKFDEVDSSSIVNHICMADIAYADSVMFNQVDGADAIYITFKVTGRSRDYSISLNGTSRLIIQLNNGTVKEVDIFSDCLQVGMTLRQSAYLMRTGNKSGFTVRTVEIPDIKQEDVSYVKLIDLSLQRTQSFGTDVKKHLELEVYKGSK